MTPFEFLQHLLDHLNWLLWKENFFIHVLLTELKLLLRSELIWANLTEQGYELFFRIFVLIFFRNLSKRFIPKCVTIQVFTSLTEIIFFY